MLKNCTPHPITMIWEGGKEILHPCGILLRVESVKKPAHIVIAGLPVTIESLGEVSGLPEPENGVHLIVSRIVAQACPDRNDLLVPNVIRDEEGKIIGCDGWSIIN